ncbi:hypothetical protein RO3G_04426 [Rhizopus delemar RA 99-880]|uniref:Uncharacterized protein n=1 Tax=Rhizopus delemar (strain RA 99-880 / ATCC MYA-4621 / FGSC 9543 / NRRL 43880) TaxID=246409 RepID=I1BU41_RHIO9|nr:hypothetical protein RO3G_04426 [Rhizopus delemar RA 99-880]|eukprot:EIE79721.1 hypothetical protein RO3G_04426 [Rhizopus delemar RA 99-880]
MFACELKRTVFGTQMRLSTSYSSIATTAAGTTEKSLWGFCLSVAVSSKETLFLTVRAF